MDKRSRYLFDLDQVPGSALIIRPDGVVLEANQDALELIGKPERDVVGRSAVSLFGDGCRERIQQVMDEAQSRGQSLAHVSLVLDRGEVPCTLQMNAKRLPQGDASPVLLQLVDESPLKSALDAAEELVQQSRQIFEQAPVPLVYIRPDGTVIRANPAYTRLLGMQPDTVSRFLARYNIREDRQLERLGLIPLVEAGLRGERVQSGIVHYDGPSLEEDDIPLQSIDARGTMFPIRDRKGRHTLSIMTLSDMSETAEALRELADREEGYRTMYNRTPVMLHSVDEEGRIVSVSDTWLERLGYTRDEVVGREMTEFFTGQSVAHAKESLQHLFREGACTDIPFEMVKKNGEVMQTLISAIAERDDTSRIVRSLAVVVDVTERNRMEQDLGRSRELLKEAERIAGLGNWVWDIQEDSYTWSDQMCHILGLDPRKVTPSGKTFFARVHVKDRRQVWRALEKALAGEDHASLQFRLDMQDGSERVVFGKSEIQRDADGRAIRMIGTIQDVTELVMMNQRLNRLATAVEAAGEGVLITDPEGIIVYANSALEKISGYSPEELIGQPTSIFRSGEQDDDFYRKMWSELNAGHVWTSEFINVKKTGEHYHIEETIAPVFDEEGRIVNYVSVERDITEQLHLKEQLFQAQKMDAIGRLAGGIAHDFNNILTVIRGYAEILELRLGNQHDLLLPANEVIKAADRASGLTSQLLAFSRKQVMHARPLHFNVVLKEMEGMIQRLIGPSIRIEYDLSAASNMVYADRNQMEQVILNLVINARDAMPDGGELTLRTGLRDVQQDDERHRAGRYVEFIVRDTGVGMRDETVAKIFDPFFTTKEQGKGTGLGLATVHGIVTQSGGFVHVESSIGRGTALHVCLPLYQGVMPEETDEIERTEGLSGSGTLLLVDDDYALLSLAELVLREHGYTVHAASTADQVLAFMEHYDGEIDLLITDVLMPETDGFDLATMLLNRDPELQLLYISGYTESDKLEKRLVRSGTYYLPKPFKPNELLSKVKEILEAAREQGRSSQAG